MQYHVFFYWHRAVSWNCLNFEDCRLMDAVISALFCLIALCWHQTPGGRRRDLLPNSRVSGCHDWVSELHRRKGPGSAGEISLCVWLCLPSQWEDASCFAGEFVLKCCVLILLIYRNFLSLKILCKNQGKVRNTFLSVLKDPLLWKSSF